MNAQKSLFCHDQMHHSQAAGYEALNYAKFTESMFSYLYSVSELPINWNSLPVSFVSFACCTFWKVGGIISNQF